MDTIYKTYRAEIKAIDEEEGIIDMLIPVTTDSVDRDGEVVEPTAFKKTLPKFMKRPILVVAHDYRDLTNQIGEWTKLKITDDGVEGKPKYYVNEGNEQADWGFKLASKGMAAFSIGFIPKVWEDGDGDKAPRRTYKEVELLEISQVIIPSNREAIQNIRSKSADPVINEICDAVEKEIKGASNQDSIIETGAGIVTKPEETEDFIHIRVRDPGDFQDGSFRTIDIDKGKGIKAVIGRLKGETSTTVQKYIFDKSKGWTMASAQAWVKEHEKQIIEYEVKGAIPYKKTSLDETGAWDAAREVASADVDDLKIMCAWVGDDSENKTSYKLPHHRAKGHACVWRAVAACAAVIMGARGGADIPESDVGGVKAHIAKHYADFDKGEPPWEKGVAQSEIADELDYVIKLIESEGMNEDVKSDGWKLVREMMRLSGNDIPVDIQAKIGAVLNQKNKDRLKEAQGLIQAVLDSAEPTQTAPPKSEDISSEDLKLAVKEVLKEMGI